jgi:hypothetical protein
MIFFLIKNQTVKIKNIGRLKRRKLLAEGGEVLHLCGLIELRVLVSHLDWLGVQCIRYKFKMSKLCEF